MGGHDDVLPPAPCPGSQVGDRARRAGRADLCGGKEIQVVRPRSTLTVGPHLKRRERVSVYVLRPARAATVKGLLGGVTRTLSAPLLSYTSQSSLRRWRRPTVWV
jgi:hypothetical protein